jgi:hypothetical protein
MTARELGAIQMALIDGIHAQHDILQQSDERPEGQPFAQWIAGEQGKLVGVKGILDLPQMARAILTALNNGDEAARRQSDAEWNALGVETALDAHSDPEAAESHDGGTTAPPDDPEPTERPVTCKHCGTAIQRHNAPAGLGWRHTETLYSACGFNSPERAEP